MSLNLQAEPRVLKNQVSGQTRRTQEGQARHIVFNIRPYGYTQMG